VRLRRRRADDDGSIALELAVIGPSLLILIFFVIQAALYFYGRSVALQSAREGVSQLRLAQTQSAYAGLEPSVGANVVAFASHVGNGALNAPAMTSTYDTNPAEVTVTVTGSTISLIPFATFTVSQTARGAVEHFQDPP
jgi:Flp pilus assembly protein TadG